MYSTATVRFCRVIIADHSLTYHTAECIYKKKWAPRPISSSKAPQPNSLSDGQSQPKALSAEDDAKLVFGTIFSLRNMVRKLGGPDDKYAGPDGQSTTGC